MKKILFVLILVLGSFSFPKKCYQSIIKDYQRTDRLEFCAISQNNSYISNNRINYFQICFGKVQQKDSTHYDFLSKSEITVAMNKPSFGQIDGENWRQYDIRRANRFFYLCLDTLAYDFMKGKIIHIDSKLKSITKKVVINAREIRIETNPVKIGKETDEISLLFEIPNIPNKTFLLKFSKGRNFDADISIRYEKKVEITSLELQNGTILAKKLFDYENVIFR